MVVGIGLKVGYKTVVVEVIGLLEVGSVLVVVEIEPELVEEESELELP